MISPTEMRHQSLPQGAFHRNPDTSAAKDYMDQMGAENFPLSAHTEKVRRESAGKKNRWRQQPLKAPKCEDNPSMINGLYQKQVPPPPEV